MLSWTREAMVIVRVCLICFVVFDWFGCLGGCYFCVSQSNGRFG